MNEARLSHVAETIREVDFRIRQLQDLARGLELLADWTRGGGSLPGVAPAMAEGKGAGTAGRKGGNVSRLVTSAATRGKGKVQASGRSAARVVNGTGKSQPETLRVAGLVGGLAEPFGTGEIREAAGLAYKAASNFVTQGKLKGWLASAGYGKVRRTKAFPKGTGERGAPERKEPAKAGTPNGKGETLDAALAASAARRKQVEEDLAVAQRDLEKHARAGNDTLARILRDKVLKLQGEYDELT